MEQTVESADFKLRYSGPAVDKGEMLLSDVMDALDGFNQVYTRLVESYDKKESQNHKIKITALEKGSFEVVLEIIKDNQGVIIATGVGFLLKIFWDIFKVKLFSKGKSISIENNGDNNSNIINSDVTIININGETMEATRKVIESLKSDIINNGISKMAAPLGNGTTCLTLESSKIPELNPLKINEKEKDYLKYKKASNSKEKIVEVEKKRTYKNKFVIISPVFDGTSKWRFKNDNNYTFTATIEDQEFLNSVRSREELFGNGDCLECLIREHEVIEGDKPKRTYFIEKVIDMIKADNYQPPSLPEKK